MPRASRAWPSAILGGEARSAAPARATRRYRAPLSSRCQPMRRATARLMVPLPEPLGPSMVTTGGAVASLMRWGGSVTVAGSASPPRGRWPRKPGKEVATLATSQISMGARALSARDREGHGDAMVAVAVDGARRRNRRPRASTGHPAAAGAQSPAPSRPGGHGGQPIAFLDAQLVRPAHHGLPARAGRGDEEHRELIDRQRHQRLGHADAVQRARAHLDVGDRLARPAARRPRGGCTRMSAPIAAASRAGRCASG